MTVMDLDEMASWIGRTESADDIVTPKLAALFGAALAPHLAPASPGEAPLGIHWCLAPPTTPTGKLGHDGHPLKGDFLPPIPLPRRMWAGGEIEIIDELRIGDAVERRSTI